MSISPQVVRRQLVYVYSSAQMQGITNAFAMHSHTIANTFMLHNAHAPANMFTHLSKQFCNCMGMCLLLFAFIIHFIKCTTHVRLFYSVYMFLLYASNYVIQHLHLNMLQFHVKVFAYCVRMHCKLFRQVCVCYTLHLGWTVHIYKLSPNYLRTYWHGPDNHAG